MRGGAGRSRWGCATRGVSAPRRETGRSQRSPIREQALPDEMMGMIDAVDVLDARRRAEGVGFVQGSKVVRPQEGSFRSTSTRTRGPGSLGLSIVLHAAALAAAEVGGAWRRFEANVRRKHHWDLSRAR